MLLSFREILHALQGFSFGNDGATRAFDLAREDPRLRDRYGRHSWGQSALLARRLVEAGVTFVTINHFEAEVDWWDDHYTIEANLKESVVTAPEQAVVEVLAVRKGDVMAPNQPVVRVLRAADLWVKAYVPETQLGKIRLGQEAIVTIDAYPERRFTEQLAFGVADFDAVAGIGSNLLAPDVELHGSIYLAIGLLLCVVWIAGDTLFGANCGSVLEPCWFQIFQEALSAALAAMSFLNWMPSNWILRAAA